MPAPHRDGYTPRLELELSEARGMLEGADAREAALRADVERLQSQLAKMRANPTRQPRELSVSSTQHGAGWVLPVTLGVFLAPVAIIIAILVHLTGG